MTSTTEEGNKTTFGDTIRFYLTALTTLIACISSFAFLFLVPFVIDPAFSTLFAEFTEEPVLCVTTSTVFKVGMSNCTWASCREGCTNEIFRCTQISVNYKLDAGDQFEGKNFTDIYTVEETEWDYEDAKLYPNVKGCGYPPQINCTAFDLKHSLVGATFPCYHSELLPDIALTQLDINQVKLDLVYAIAIPWSLFLSSILYLLITYVGMSKPNPKEDEPQEISPSKASKDASNYSLRSIGKSINNGVNKLRGEREDKGTVHPVEKCSLPPVDEVGSLNNTFGKTFSTSTSSLPITKDNNYKPKIITPGNTHKDFTVTRDSICGDGHCLGDNNLLLEPSTLQQVHSRRCTALPPLSRTPPALPRPVGSSEQVSEESRIQTAND